MPAPALTAIAVTGSLPSIAVGQSESFSATGMYTDGSTQNLTTQVSWSSSSVAIGTINAGGVATAVSSGSTSITATLGSVSGAANLDVSYATIGLTWPVATYEAEAGTLGGAASIVGAADGSDRAVGDLGGEASQRQAVLLTQVGDTVSWIVQGSESGANALVVRFSIPDVATGGGTPASLGLTIVDASGRTLQAQLLALTSRYSWLYGGVKDGTKLYNSPSFATQYATASGPTHIYDEIQLRLNMPLPAGATITLTKTAASNAASIAVDFIDLETVPPPISLPQGFVSLTDARCGGIAVDLRQTGSAFDGADDSSYGSIFNAVTGTNPYNPTEFGTKEKDYYSTSPSTDPLQDTTANSATADLSMFALADHNLQSLTTCMNLVVDSGGALTGVYVPAGRFYVRGRLLLPSNVTLQGAGMWYTKFAAVDTAPPTSETSNGVTGIAAVSGNLSIGALTGRANNVVLSNFAIFGNVTQRDVIDDVLPDGVHAVYTNSIIDNIWVEHMFSGLKLLGNSSGDTITNSRVRNTFAGGVELYGSTSFSTISHSTARSTGDDGFALWSQGTTIATSSQGNTVSDSLAQLQWYGNGFAIYGGNSMSITQSRAADILNYPCLRISTYFVSALLPSSATASADADHLNFHRCGGNGFNHQFGALLLETNLESFSNITLNEINVAQPAYKGLDVRETTMPPATQVVATMQATLGNIQLVGAPACASVGPFTSGSIALNNVCTCTSSSSVPQTCGVTVNASSALGVAANSCSMAACSSF